MVEKAVGFKGKVKILLMQGLAGLMLIVAAIIALKFLVGLVSWLISMALLLVAGYIVWRIFKAVFF